jgi:hypothetical protein
MYLKYNCILKVRELVYAEEIIKNIISEVVGTFDSLEGENNISNLIQKFILFIEGKEVMISESTRNVFDYFDKAMIMILTHTFPHVNSPIFHNIIKLLLKNIASAQ